MARWYSKQRKERMRLVLVCTRSAHPLTLDLPEVEHAPASTFIDFNAGKWSPMNKPGRAVATLNRVANGRAAFGDRFVMPYYGSGSGLTGRSLARPIGTITTRDRWAVVDGDHMRMLTVDETALAMSFPLTTKRPAVKKLAVHMLGNAVPPLAGQRFIEALRAAA